MAGASTVVLRAPSILKVPTPRGYGAPGVAFLLGTWHVTHSTLPMWRNKRNVRISYSRLAPSSPSIAAEETDRLDDVVTYQSLDSDKVHTVHGVDKSSGETRDTWDWRGSGWLKIASSHWEVLGWGDEGGTGADNSWVVTYFAKTLFTPAGVDVYSRRQQGLSQDTVQQIKAVLIAIEGQEFRALAESLFDIDTE